MSPVLEPMTFDDLSELYRVEMKSSAITQVRKDLFRATADLLSRLRIDYDKQMSIDPESVMCEGANQRRKKAERLCKDIMHIRTQKICQMAIRGALGADNHVEMLTDEERAYYDSILDSSKRHLSEIDRLRGRKNIVETHIDEIPRRADPVPEPVVEATHDPEPVAEPMEPVMEVRNVEEDVFQEPADAFDDFPPEESFDDDPVPMDDVEEIPAAEAEAVVEGIVDEDTGSSDDDLSTVVIRVLEDLPPFVGPERDYNLMKEDVVTMPAIMADALVNGGKAAIIRPTL